jgi:DNA-binding beta-propeller fold protein YncE
LRRPLVVLTRALLVAAGLALLASGCSRRVRDNPLDPRNPETGGRPAGFNAVAGYTLVTLSWSPQTSLEIDGFQLERLVAGDSLYRPVTGVLANDVSGYVDAGRTNGVTVHYRLYFVIGGVPARLPAEDFATPGPLRPWVTEYDGGSLARLSPDGRHVVLRSGGMGSVEGLAIDTAPGAQRIWCTSQVDGWLSSVDVDGAFRLRQEGLQAPNELAVSPGDGSVWVCDRSGDLLHFGADGQPAGPASVGPLATPEGIAISARDLTIWVCEGAGNRVRRYTPAGSIIASTPIVQPFRVAVDSLTNIGWVTSYTAGKVWQIAGDGTLLDSASVGGPVGLAIDRAHERVWIADQLDGALLALDPSTMARVLTIGNLPGVRDVAVDRATGDAWATLPGSGTVLRVDKNGHELSRLTGLGTPLEIRLDPGNF